MFKGIVVILTFINKIKKTNINVKFFILGLFITAISSTALINLYSNYLHDVFNINAKARGFIEFPRELPGLLATFIIAFIYFLGDIKIIAISVLISSLGFFGLGLVDSSFSAMLFFTILWSTGEHIYMSMREVVAIKLSSNKNKGIVLGLINSIRSMGIITGSLLIWISMGKFGFNYKEMFWIFSGLIFIAFILFSKMNINVKNNNNFNKTNKNDSLIKKKIHLVFRKDYKIFYILAALFGIRKQLFLVFAPWLLIRLFNQESEDLAFYYLIAATLGIFIKPIFGKAIDYFGERKVLFIDAVLIFILSINYVFAPKISDTSLALGVLYTCFILDELLFSLRTARTTYLYKILKKESDLAPTLAMGISIEHLVSMLAPAIAGIIWITYGYEYVFAITSFVAVLSAIASLYIKKIKK